jgi:hypothetical protein
MSSGDPNHYDDYGGEDDSGLQHGQFRLYGETIPVHNLNWNLFFIYTLQI